MQQHNIEFIHLQGKINVVAEALSRFIQHDSNKTPDLTEIETILTVEEENDNISWLFQQPSGNSESTSNNTPTTTQDIQTNTEDLDLLIGSNFTI